MLNPKLEMNKNHRPFSGPLGEDYDFIKLMCPNVPILHQKSAALIGAYRPDQYPLRILELGCGTGLLTAAILTIKREGVRLLAVDNEPTMLKQAERNLAEFVERGMLTLEARDALSSLAAAAPHSYDIVAAAYTLHNFEKNYRQKVFQAIRRVLKPGGLFLNADRYALDNVREHTEGTQREVTHYFKVFGELQRYDLLEKWIVHLVNDESPDHIMREDETLKALRRIGFVQIACHFRQGVDGLFTAEKPV
jgi:ubiquinone/menaquinone biosynthesis C-methylase UbiE